MADALTFNDVRRSFGRVEALRGLSFGIPEKAVAAFVGSNGAGKTTTFSLVGQFIRLHGGSISIFGESLARYRRFGGLIGLLPQDMLYFEDRSVFRQLKLFARLAGLAPGAASQEVDRVLELVRLTDRADEKAGDLSHGMRVRLGVAQALIAEPPLVLLDEPTSGLDPIMQVEFRQTVEAVRGRTTVVISSHDLSQLEGLCDYCCMIDRGQLIKQGPMSQVISGSMISVLYRVERLTMDTAGLEQRLPGVDIILEGPGELVVEFDRSRYKLPEMNRIVLSWLLEHGVAVIELKQRQSLEEAFLAATGRH